MFKIELSVSEDRKTFSLSLPLMPSRQEMSTNELSELIRQLAWAREAMIPPHENADPKSDTPISVVPAIRWYVSDDDLPGQCRISVLHPGFGWLWLPMDKEAFERMVDIGRRFFRSINGWTPWTAFSLFNLKIIR